MISLTPVYFVMICDKLQAHDYSLNFDLNQSRLDNAGLARRAANAILPNCFGGAHVAG
jgi:hypothetical protein